MLLVLRFSRKGTFDGACIKLNGKNDGDENEVVEDGADIGRGSGSGEGLFQFPSRKPLLVHHLGHAEILLLLHLVLLVSSAINMISMLLVLSRSPASARSSIEVLRRFHNDSHATAVRPSPPPAAGVLYLVTFAAGQRASNLDINRRTSILPPESTTPVSPMVFMPSVAPSAVASSPLHPEDRMVVEGDTKERCEPKCTTGMKVMNGEVFGADDSDLNDMIAAVNDGMSKGIEPVADAVSCGGAYFMRDEKKRIRGVFKPLDEEPYAPFNAKGFIASQVESSIRGGIKPGEAANREVLAYCLDSIQPSSFKAGVPATCVVQSCHPSFNYTTKNDAPEVNLTDHKRDNLHWKEGSLQTYVSNIGDSEDMGSSTFSLSDVQNIAMLDIRLLNLDRHAGNLLVDKNHNLIPIDHGQCLPSFTAIDGGGENWNLCWKNWRQASNSFSDEQLDYIRSIDCFKDADAIAKKMENLRGTALRTDEMISFHIGTALLKMGAARAMTPHDIAQFWLGGATINGNESFASKLQMVINTVDNSSSSARDSKLSIAGFLEAFLPKLEAALDIELDRTAKPGGALQIKDTVRGVSET